jgi:hypothetical protein
MKKTIGILMIISLFSGLFTWMVLDSSIIIALQTFGITAVVVIFVGIAVTLMVSET